MTTSNLIELPKDNDFQRFTRFHLIRLSKAIEAESASIPNHEERLVLARKIRNNAASYIERFCWMIIHDTDLAAIATPAQITSTAIGQAVERVWNLFIFD